MRISASVEHTAQVLSAVVTAFVNRHPDVRVELVVSDKVQDLVAEGIDVAIRVGWMRRASSRMTKLGDFAQGVLASPAYLARHWPAASAGRACRSPLDRPDAPALAIDVDVHEGRKTTTVRMNPHLRTDSAVALRALLVEGAGVSVGSLLHVGNEIRNGSLIRLLPESTLPSGVVHAVFPPGAQVAPRPARSSSWSARWRSA